MREIEVRELPYLPLGHQGENEAQRIVWRGLADSWARLYGEGVFALTVLREGDGAPYPASVMSENGDVIWTLSNADTAKAGEGMAELTYTVGGVIAKSRTWHTVVEPSLSANGTTEPPAAYQSWVDEVLQAAADVETAVSKMPYVDETTGNWFKWDATAGAFADTGVAATGPTGPEGPKGETGSGFKVLGYYGTKAALDAAQKATAAAGDAYGVGTVEPYDIYIFDGITGEFINNGPLQGAKGDTGPEGPQGPKGDKGDKGEPGGGAGQPAVEIDLSDSITMNTENPFVSNIEVGYDKSVGEKIKRAALAGSAKVTISLKVGVGEPEKVTLPMSGTQSALNDGSPAYGLTGTYVCAGVIGLDIMIATAISDNSCTVVKHIAPWHQKPIYDPVDKPDTTPDGAFLRWSGEQKKWVAEKSPVFIDLYSAGVNVDVEQYGKYLTYETTEDIVTQLVTAAKTGGALLKFGFMTDGIPVPVQAYLMGSAIEIMQAYQFSGKVTIGANAINVFVVVQLQDSSTQVSTCCTVDQNLPLPETTNEGAFLRVQDGVWAAVQVPAAEEASF